MEFEFNEDLSAVRGLAEQIFAARSDVEQLRKIEQSGGFDADLWKTLADADLIGIAVPESAGGAGLGMLGLVAVLEQQGRRVAQVPMAITAAAPRLGSRLARLVYWSAFVPAEGKGLLEEVPTAYVELFEQLAGFPHAHALVEHA